MNHPNRSEAVAALLPVALPAGPRALPQAGDPHEEAFAALEAFLAPDGSLRPYGLHTVGPARDGSGVKRGEGRAALLNDLRAQAWASATLRAYGAHVRAWRDWCRAEGMAPLPLDSEGVAAHLLDVCFIWGPDGEVSRDADGEPICALSRANLHQRVAALALLASFVGCPNPAEDAGVRQTVKGLVRRLGRRPVVPRAALDMQGLSECLGTLTGRRPQALLVRVLVLLRWRATLSAAELSQLSWTDVHLFDSHVDIRRGDRVWSTEALGGSACLVTALHDLQDVQSGEGRLARHDDGRPFGRAQVHRMVSTVGAWEDLPHRTAPEVEDMLERAPTACDLATVRDRALLLVGFFSALRRSNLSALNWGDLVDHGDDGIRVTVRRSKTDQEGVGRTLWLPSVDGEVLCPSHALRAWLRLLRLHVGRHPRADEPVFPRLQRDGSLGRQGVQGSLRRLSGAGINSIVQAAAKSAGLEDAATAMGYEEGKRAAFGAHSLRAGFVTEGLRNDRLSVAEVQDVTGHKNVTTLLAYRREVNARYLSGARRLLSPTDASERE